MILSIDEHKLAALRLAADIANMINLKVTYDVNVCNMGDDAAAKIAALLEKAASGVAISESNGSTMASVRPVHETVPATMQQITDIYNEIVKLTKL